VGAGLRQRGDDLEALTYANFICNEDGMDPISFGATIGARDGNVRDGGADQGADRDRGGRSGRPRPLTYLAEVHRARRGVWARKWGWAPRRLTAKYGHPDLSMSVKGQEFPAYDSRGIQGWA